MRNSRRDHLGRVHTSCKAEARYQTEAEKGECDIVVERAEASAEERLRAGQSEAGFGGGVIVADERPEDPDAADLALALEAHGHPVFLRQLHGQVSVVARNMTLPEVEAQPPRQ